MTMLMAASGYFPFGNERKGTSFFLRSLSRIFLRRGRLGTLLLASNNFTCCQVGNSFLIVAISIANETNDIVRCFAQESNQESNK